MFLNLDGDFFYYNEQMTYNIVFFSPKDDGSLMYFTIDSIHDKMSFIVTAI